MPSQLGDRSKGGFGPVALLVDDVREARHELLFVVVAGAQDLDDFGNVYLCGRSRHGRGGHGGEIQKGLPTAGQGVFYTKYGGDGKMVGAFGVNRR